MNWKKYITDPRTGLPQRGAISRIAELLSTHYGTVKRLFLDVCKPTADEANGLRAIVQSRTVLAAKKRSDAGQPRGKYRQRAAVKSGVAAPQLKALRSAKNTARKLN
jgi:hypothetical protein